MIRGGSDVLGLLHAGTKGRLSAATMLQGAITLEKISKKSE